MSSGGCSHLAGKWKFELRQNGVSSQKQMITLVPPFSARGAYNNTRIVVQHYDKRLNLKSTSFRGGGISFAAVTLPWSSLN